MNKINCIGIIPDGNRRWSDKNNVSYSDGYKKGFSNLIKTISIIKDRGIKNLVVFGFSEDNWKRMGEEKENEFFNIFKKEDIGQYIKKGIKIIPVGDLDKFPEFAKKEIKKIQERTTKEGDIKVYILLSYNGQEEIVKATNRLIEKGERVDKETFKNELITKDIPEPDLIIRTGNARRLSGFLTYLSTYSELYFLDKLWPDLSKEDLEKIIEHFNILKLNKGE